jgi:hypothetical protein
MKPGWYRALKKFAVGLVSSVQKMCGRGLVGSRSYKSGYDFDITSHWLAFESCVVHFFQIRNTLLNDKLLVNNKTCCFEQQIFISYHILCIFTHSKCVCWSEQLRKYFNYICTYLHSLFFLLFVSVCRRNCTVWKKYKTKNIYLPMYLLKKKCFLHFFDICIFSRDI